MIEAQLADGRTLQFPDGTDPSVVQMTVKKVMGVMPPTPGPASQEPPSAIERFGHGMSNVGDEIKKLYFMATGNQDALAQTQGTQNAGNEVYDRGVQKGQAQAEQRFGKVNPIRAAVASMLPMGADIQAQAYAAAGGGPDTMSELGTLTPTAVLGAGAMPARLGMRLAAAAGIGGVQGALEPNADANPASKALQAARGAIAGTAVQGGGEIVGKIAAPVVDAVSTAFKAVRNRISGATDQGQVQTTLATALKDAGLDWNALPADRQDAITASATQTLKAGRELDPEALLRKADFDALGAPATLGQITRDARQWTAEQRVRKIEGVGDPLQNTLETQNQVLAAQLPAMRNGTGSTAGSGYEAAENARAAVHDYSSQAQKNVASLYDQAAAHGGDVPFDGASFMDKVKPIFETFEDKISGPVKKRIQELDSGLQLDTQGAVADGTTPRAFTVDEATRLYKLINDSMGGEPGGVGKAANALKTALMDVGTSGATTQPAMGMFQQATAAARNRFQTLEPTPIKALAETGEAPVNFVETKILGGKPGEVSALRDVVTKQNPAAWDDVRASVLDWLTQKAQSRGTFNGGAFKDALDRIGNARLKVLFSEAERAQLGTISRAGFNATVAPPLAAVNTSNTASELANLLSSKDTGPGIIGSLASHIPVVGRMGVGAYQFGRQQLADRALRGAAQSAAAPDLAALAPKSKTNLSALAQLLLRMGPGAGANYLAGPGSPLP